MSDRTANGQAFRMLNVVDEYTRKCLAIKVERKLGSPEVLETLGELFVSRGPPEHLRSDNGPEGCAQAVKDWLGRLQVKTLFIEPGSPWENGYALSFNSKLRDELLNGERFTTLLEAQVLVAGWRYHYKRFSPHSALGYRPPAPEATLFPDLANPPFATQTPLMT